MNILKILAYAITLIMLPIVTTAQNSKEEEIRKMEQIEANAIQHLDTVTISILWSKDFVINTPRNNVINRAAALSTLKKGRMHYSSLQRETEKITVINNIGIAMGQEIVQPTDGSNAGKTVKRRYTNIWMQSNNTWMLIARQATNILIE